MLWQGVEEQETCSASILDSVCNAFLQSTQSIMGCELYCTVGLFGEVHGKLELLVLMLSGFSAARSGFIGKCCCKARIQLVSSILYLTEIL